MRAFFCFPSIEEKSRRRQKTLASLPADHAPGMIYRMPGAFCTGELLLRLRERAKK